MKKVGPIDGDKVIRWIDEIWYTLKDEAMPSIQLYHEKEWRLRMLAHLEQAIESGNFVLPQPAPTEARGWKPDDVVGEVILPDVWRDKLRDDKQNIGLPVRGRDLYAQVQPLLRSSGDRDRWEAIRQALEGAEAWRADDGCDCGIDEPGTCALCLVRAELKALSSSKQTGANTKWNQ